VTVTFSLVAWSSSSPATSRGDAGAPSSDISGVSRVDDVVVAVDAGEPGCACWCCCGETFAAGAGAGAGAGLRWREAGRVAIGSSSTWRPAFGSAPSLYAGFSLGFFPFSPFPLVLVLVGWERWLAFGCLSPSLAALLLPSEAMSDAAATATATAIPGVCCERRHRTNSQLVLLGRGWVADWWGLMPMGLLVGC
jgi:hypothetical protein